MANLFESYGLEFISDDDDTLEAIVGYTVSDGKAIVGYYGNPYFYMPTGDVEFWASTTKKADGKSYIDKINVHCGNKTVWNMLCSGIDITPKSAPKTRKVLMLNRSEDANGLLPVEIINADVLPCFLRGEEITLQLVAQCLDIMYYASQDEYSEAMPTDKNGKKWGIANGSLAPINFMVNHSPDNYTEGQDYEDDCFVHFTATVKALYQGIFELGENKSTTFIRCVADTQFGELEFHHSFDQVPEDMRDNIHVGAVISGVCIISGDAAIYKYEDGIVKDLDHNLRLLRNTIEEGNPERLRRVLSENCVYETDTYDTSYRSADAVIERLQYVADNHVGKIFTHMAEITDSDGDTEFPIGTKCLILAYDDEDNYESIAFVSVDDEGNIVRIKISNDSRYHFHVEQPKIGKSIVDDIDIPDSVVEPIFLRAKFLGIIDDDTELEQIICDSNYSSHEFNALEMLNSLKNSPHLDTVSAIKNSIGYLFAKAIEQEANENKVYKELSSGCTASYCPDDAFNGKICSNLSPEKHAILAEAMETGKQFGTDLFTFMQLADKSDDDFIDTYKLAAIVVQRIGRIYSLKCFNREGGC